MCSVVEIKNLDEYCIHYHSLDSMETVDGTGGIKVPNR